MVSFNRIIFVYFLITGNIVTDNIMTGNSFLIPSKYNRRCPLLREKITTMRNYRAAKCTFWKLSKHSDEFQKKGLEVILQEEVNFLKFILNNDEVFLINELIAVILHKNELKMNKESKINLATMILQMVLKRFLIPLVLKHEFYILHEFLKSLFE